MRLVMIASLLLCACSSTDPAEVKRERGTYGWVAPMLRAYIANDPLLYESQKAVHLISLDLWHASILHAEHRAGIGPWLPPAPTATKPRARAR
jgi:hypothetical protein